MEGVSIVETALLEKMIYKLEEVHEEVMTLKKERQENLSPYQTTDQVCKLTGMSRSSVIRNKNNLGCSKQGGTLFFDRESINAFIKSTFFKK
jgi:hypothetical protein